VHYVIVGAYERAVYAPVCPATIAPADRATVCANLPNPLAKFEFLRQQGVLTPVYENPGTVIYQVNPTLAGE
jgi:hypothetical protein